MDTLNQIDAATWVLICVSLLLLAQLFELYFFCKLQEAPKYRTADSKLISRQIAAMLKIPDTYPHAKTPAELALDNVRAQASAVARHDICQNLGVPLRANPYQKHTVQHEAWAEAYARSMRIAIQIERSKS
jgi:hypothetical protein